MFVEIAEPIETPNGVLVDGNRLIVGTMGAAQGARGAQGAQGAPAGGHLIAFDLRTKAKTEITPQPLGGIDGIESDGRGGFLVTDVFGMRLLHVSASGRRGRCFSSPPPELTSVTSRSRQVAVVPFLFGNSVAAYDLSGVSK